MPTSTLLARRGLMVAIGVVAILAVGLLFAFEPITRSVVSTDAWCMYCHLEQEYSPDARLSASKHHPLEPVKDKPPTTCVDCHLPTGFVYSIYAYTHYASATDLFGHFRDRDGERAGDWIPLSAARAYRVRDMLMKYDSSTCRTCHIESEIKPKRKRGERAHQKALDQKQTCIECHDNLVHRFVESKTSAAAESEEEEGETKGQETSEDPFATDSFEGEQAESDPFASEGFDAPAGKEESGTKSEDEFDASNFEEQAP